MKTAQRGSLLTLNASAVSSDSEADPEGEGCDAWLGPAVKIDAISADKIVIIRVCDDAGCIDLASTRRVTSGGIRVEYQVQADDLAIESIQSALESDSFGSAFERSMAANGYEVKADITTSSAPATPTPANVGGTDDTPSPPADSASKR